MDGNIFVSGSSDLAFRVWDIRMKKAAFRAFEKNKCGISAVRFMPDNLNTIAVGYEDSSIKIWDLRALGKVAKLTDDNCIESVQMMVFSNSGRILFSSYQNTKIHMWDILTESKIGVIESVHTDLIRSISLSEDGSQLISAGKDGLIA
mmetsp:Transcript_12483/g.8702  ORF Transcript_12483/g.8702 Transcript_12483/m.8702 type:complete len:148 (+) Transcript_12483:683-1126(+)|eukprot:CAMPEP_0116872894 /NCGR_PEP_ID=MMETSP0463-20121206/3817_1 /TAXON_ID=181622 /ORGANISM="Strombidinopsis sp, Strain SopsisLIS2011" /LENGTH=147 /DNA_ID=CAMNT_0004513917 /DNA_START=628 /DNA_END=1071 /DNA_ORIENTATION=+